MAIKIEEKSIGGVFEIESQRFSDQRGSFLRIYCHETLKDILSDRNISQINHSVTREVGTVRGMHFQYPPFAEMKIIQCVRGRVFDVAVDLRQGSDTFLQWTATVLSPENSNALVIPEGFAHGFQTLENDSELIYLHTRPYVSTSEGAIIYNDPRVSINWPLTPVNISPRDQTHQMLAAEFRGIAL